MMAMTSGVERVDAKVSDGAEWGELLLLLFSLLLLFGPLVSGLEVNIMVVVKVVEGRVIV